MKKISAEKFVEGVNSIYIEEPAYKLGHDGSDGYCDCIGMPRGSLEREGVTGGTNMGGTNQAARKTILDLQPINSVSQLRLGDVVLKTRDKDDADMRLPDRYRKGGADYDSRWGETNFTHIGTVTQVNPLRITHMTSPTAKIDTKLGNWKYSGRLPWVDYGDQAGTDPDAGWDEAETATVIAEKGSTVKMRAKPSDSCRLYWDVPIGSKVIVDSIGEKWTAITWRNQMGYMMTKFLLFGDEPAAPDTYTVIISGVTKEKAEELCRTWSRATMQKE